MTKVCGMPLSEQLRIAIRVDASAQIGTGHLQRMLALAFALSERGAALHFVTRSLGLDCKTAIHKKGFNQVTMLDAPHQAIEEDGLVPYSAWAQVPWQKDVADTVQALDDWSPDWVIIDSYAFDARWHLAIEEALGAKIVVVDDLADRALAASVLIDHNFHIDHRQKYAGRLSDGAVFCTGPEFAMIDQVYASTKRYSFREEVRSIGIFMGGADAQGHSSDVLDALNKIGWQGRVEIASTSANPALPKLQARAKLRARTELTLDQPNLANFFARHDLQIGAGGGATWERCCIGAPTLALVCADNQRFNIPFLADAGVLVALDMLADDQASRRRLVHNLASAIASIIAAPGKRADMHKLSQLLIDGLGTFRIADAIFDLSEGYVNLETPPRIGAAQ